jgi:hypothetical protein
MESKSVVATALVKTLVLVFLGVTSFFAQTQNKVVEWSKSPIGSNKGETAAGNLRLSKQIDAIEIQNVTVSGKSITIGEPFGADDDWLRAIVVRVKNLSNERFAAIQITLRLPQLRASPDIQYCYGCAQDEKEKGVKPGEEVELRILGDALYDWVKSRIAEQASISTITEAEIYNMMVTLPGGAVWESGCVKTANPKEACQFAKP